MISRIVINGKTIASEVTHTSESGSLSIVIAEGPNKKIKEEQHSLSDLNKLLGYNVSLHVLSGGVKGPEHWGIIKDIRSTKAYYYTLNIKVFKRASTIRSSIKVTPELTEIIGGGG